MNSTPKFYTVFDLEIIKEIKDKSEFRDPSKLGFACGVTYNSRTDRYAVFYEEDVYDFILTLGCSQCLISFNGIKFDLKVLEPYTYKSMINEITKKIDDDLERHWEGTMIAWSNIQKLPHIDLLDLFNKKYKFRVSLDNFAAHTLGEKKIATGSLAPQLHRQKKYIQLSEYCKKDVELTKALFLTCLQGKRLSFLNKSKNVVESMDLPLDL